MNKDKILGVIKSGGFLLCYVALQILVIVGILTYKAFTDVSYYANIVNVIETYGEFSPEYFKMLTPLTFQTLIMSDILIFLPFLVHSFRKKGNIVRKVSKQTMAYIVSLGIVANVIVSAAVSLLPDIATGKYNGMMSTITGDSFLLSFLVVGILTPIIEEIIFRYGIIECTKKNGVKFAVVTSSIVFGIAHFNLIQSTYAFVLGLILGYLYTKQYNLLHSIIFHVTVNASSILFEFYGEKYLPVFLSIMAMSVLYLVSYAYNNKTLAFILKGDKYEGNERRVKVQTVTIK